MKQTSTKQKSKDRFRFKPSQLFAVAAVVLSLTAVVSMYVLRPGTASADSNKLIVCSATDSDGNPYSQTSANGNVQTGPIWNSTLKAQRIKWGDIIPPTAAYPNGLNWTGQGQAIYNNGCNLPTGVAITATQPPVIPPMRFNQYYIFTFVAPDHYHYEVNGQVLSSGQSFAANGSTITVTAVADSGYVFSGTSSWDYTLTPVPGC